MHVSTNVRTAVRAARLLLLLLYARSEYILLQQHTITVIEQNSAHDNTATLTKTHSAMFLYHAYIDAAEPAIISQLRTNTNRLSFLPPLICPSPLGVSVPQHKLFSLSFSPYISSQAKTQPTILTVMTLILNQDYYGQQRCLTSVCACC
jgi:hypothetical protein